MPFRPTARGPGGTSEGYDALQLFFGFDYKAATWALFSPSTYPEGRGEPARADFLRRLDLLL